MVKKIEGVDLSRSNIDHDDINFKNLSNFSLLKKSTANKLFFFWSKFQHYKSYFKIRILYLPIISRFFQSYIIDHKDLRISNIVTVFFVSIFSQTIASGITSLDKPKLRNLFSSCFVFQKNPTFADENRFLRLFGPVYFARCSWI